MLVFRVGDFTHPHVWEVVESERVADAWNRGAGEGGKDEDQMNVCVQEKTSVSSVCNRNCLYICLN